MDMSQYAKTNSLFLNTNDLKDLGPIKWTIAFVEPGRFEKPNLVFENGKKLGVNPTNARVLINAWGTDSNGWIGHEVQLRLTKVKFGGVDRDMIAIDPINAPAQPASKAQTRKDLDDDIPF
jgi:hypothetical protein